MAELMLPETKELAEHREHVSGVRRVADQYAITKADDVAVGEEILRNIKQAKDTIGSRKTEITRPLMQALASARDLFKPFEDALVDSAKIVKDKILDFEAVQHEAAEKEEERIRRRVEKGTMKPETAMAKLEGVEKVKTNSRTIVKVRIIDEALVPREWCAPDIKKITEAVLRDGAVIPGVERYEDKILVTR